MNDSSYTRFVLAAARIALGWLMFYAGITKVINPAWSAAGYLNTAKTFPDFYAWLTQPGLLPVVNFVNEWGLTLLGVSLILGVFVRLAGIFGAILMALYYFPVLTFPMVGTHSYLVDEHIIYALMLLFFASVGAGRVWGLERWCASLPLCSKFPKLRAWLG